MKTITLILAIVLLIIAILLWLGLKDAKDVDKETLIYTARSGWFIIIVLAISKIIEKLFELFL